MSFLMCILRKHIVEFYKGEEQKMMETLNVMDKSFKWSLLHRKEEK